MTVPTHRKDAEDRLGHQRTFLRPTVASAAALVAVALPSFMLGAFAPAIKDDLGFGDTALGALFSLGYLLSAVGLQFGGVAADHEGPRRIIRAGLVVASIGTVVIGGVADTYLILLIGFSVVRIAEALVQPATNTLISVAVPVPRRGIAMGTKQAAIPLSTTLSGLAVPLLGDSIGWEGSFLCVAVVAGAAWVVMPGAPSPQRHPQQRSRRELWRVPHLRLLAAAGACAAASVVTVAGFLTTAAIEAGYSEASAGLLLTLGGLIMIASRLAWGLLADRFGFDRFVAVGAAVGLGALAYLLFATESKPLLVVGTVLVFGIGWSWPGLMILGVIEHHPDQPGAASAVLQTGVRLGALVSPIAFGALAERAGFQVAWFLPFGFAVLATVLMFAGARAAARSADPGADGG